MDPREELINAAYEMRFNLEPSQASVALQETLDSVIADLNQGRLRVAEKIHEHWQVHTWLKKAVLLYFRVHENRVIEGAHTQFFDKVPMKFSGYSQADYLQQGIRIVPPATARYGSFIGKNTVLMPSYVNIGAYIDDGTMVDTWATIGSCAQIGKHVHISGGVGIGGVLEPIQANPVIIEDNCFIGARSEIVEGVIVEEGSVISMGVFIGQSTRIYHRETGDITYGKVPAGSVVVSGNLPAKDGSHSLYCAVIVKKVDAKTREKIGINELLRIVDNHE